MNQDLRVALVTSLNDKLVGPLRRSLDEVERNLKDVEKELTRVTQGSQRAGTAMAGMQGPAQAAKQAADLARNTENAVRLAERLKNVWSAAGGLMNGVVKGMAAYQAARYVVAPAMQQARSYDRQLADTANTAFSDRDLAGRRAGMGELDATVTAALRAGGGKREDVLQALNDMLASGTVTAGQAQGLLPTITKYATAGNANVTELSNIVVRALQNGFKEADIPKVLDMALAAGQKGGFELKDMAKWLPKLLAAGQMSGLGGMEGYARILASAQGSVITAGSKDEAGNNLLNLLLKINSQDTANDAKKLGINLSGSLAAARDKGVNSLDAFVNLVDQIAGRDSRLVALRKQASAAGSDEERRASLTAQADILQGSAIGKIVQDRQALLSLVAELNKRDYISGVKGEVMQANGQFGASNFALVSGTADFRVQQKENEKLFAVNSAMGGPNEALAKLADATSSVYQQFPGFAAAIEGAKLALMGLAAAAGAAGLMGLLTGRGKDGGLSDKAAMAGARMLGMVNLGSTVAVGAAGAAGYGAGTLLYRGIEDTGVGDAVGGGVARLLALLGNDDAKAAVAAREKYEAQMAAERQGLAAQTKALSDLAQRPIKVYLNEREIGSTVDSYLNFQARRN